MTERWLSITVLAFTFVTAVDCQGVITNNNHHRQRRFVFYPGSVLQLAAGMAIPAEVKNKIIYTNYGIMINYDLPTNLSSLLPISIVEELRGSKSFDQLSSDLFLRVGWHRGCWLQLQKWVDENENFSGSVMHELATMLLREAETNELLRRDMLDISSSFDGCPLLDGQIINR